MITCNCPPPASLPDLECVRCSERFGQIQKVAFQRIMNDDGTKNKFSAVSGFSEINSLANWQARITAADSTKIVISPYIYSPTQESGAARTFGGGNDSLGGVEEIIGREPSTFSASLRNVPQSIAKVIKSLQCENIGVYLIDGNGNVEALGIVDENNNEWIMPIPIKAFFVGDKTHGGIDAPDANVIQWSFVPNYSDYIKIFTIDTFNVLSDLCDGSVPPTPKRADIPDVATITYYATSDTTSCIFGYKSEYSTSGYTMLGYLDDENLIEIWQDGTNIMFLSDADMYAPSSCRAMFYAYHDLLQIDLSNFNTANVTDMGSMFTGCSVLTTLDLSNFSTANVTTMYMMFNSCSSLTTIYGGDWIKNASLNSSRMFIACTSLVGGNGTHYNSSHTDATYARIDRAGTPGYFTQA